MVFDFLGVGGRDNKFGVAAPRTTKYTSTNNSNPIPNPRLYQVKLKNYGIKFMPDKNRSHKAKTCLHCRLNISITVKDMAQYQRSIYRKSDSASRMVT